MSAWLPPLAFEDLTKGPFRIEKTNFDFFGDERR
jgi:hypothetical protein